MKVLSTVQNMTVFSIYNYVTNCIMFDVQFNLEKNVLKYMYLTIVNKYNMQNLIVYVKVWKNTTCIIGMKCLS